MPRMSSLAFFHLVVSCSMTVAEAAARYGRSVRTIRRWCEELPIGHRLGGGPHRISVPLADLYAFGRRSELAAFLDGKAPVDILCEAFEPSSRPPRRARRSPPAPPAGGRRLPPPWSRGPGRPRR